VQVNKILRYLYSGTTYFVQEFVGQITAAVILLAALVSWFYFSSIYAAIPVVLLGFLAWGLVSKAFKKSKSGNPNDASH
jgi:hypothetical protein